MPPPPLVDYTFPGSRRSNPSFFPQCSIPPKESRSRSASPHLSVASLSVTPLDTHSPDRRRGRLASQVEELKDVFAKWQNDFLRSMQRGEGLLRGFILQPLGHLPLLQIHHELPQYTAQQEAGPTLQGNIAGFQIPFQVQGFQDAGFLQ